MYLSVHVLTCAQMGMCIVLFFVCVCMGGETVLG